MLTGPFPVTEWIIFQLHSEQPDSHGKCVYTESTLSFSEFHVNSVSDVKHFTHTVQLEEYADFCDSFSIAHKVLRA